MKVAAGSLVPPHQFDLVDDSVALRTSQGQLPWFHRPDPQVLPRRWRLTWTNLTAAAKTAGVGHYVALSIVGCDGLPDSGYMRAKVAQERIITESGLPYTIVRATQFHEFAEAITASLTVDGEVRVPEGLIQPIAGADVAAEVARAAQAAPVNGIVNIGGPDKLTFAGLAKLALSHRGESLPIVVDPAAVYFGTKVGDTGLVTSGDAILSDLHLADWLATQ